MCDLLKVESNQSGFFDPYLAAKHCEAHAVILKMAFATQFLSSK
jgi:hypothetical protein